MQTIQRISSNWTLLLKVFIPTFWFVFYGAILIALFVSPLSEIAANNKTAVKFGVLIFYLSGSVVLYFTVMNLKRVEYDRDFLYISNYFKTIRIPWHNVERIKEQRFLFIHFCKFRFKEPVSFGKSISFIASRSLLKLFKEAHPEYAA